ncbi:MAG: hypothetical protein HUJ88_11585 [Fusobacterium necrophorum]|nr:hypothetical protein [Fusobacterium necrophorum]
MILQEILTKLNINKCFLCSENKKIYRVTEDMFLEADGVAIEKIPYELLFSKFEEVEEKSNGWSKYNIRQGDEYFTITESGVVQMYELNSDYDNFLYGKYNKFSEEKKANEINDYQELYRKIKKFADQNNEKINWDDKSYKYFIYCQNHDLRTASHYSQRQFGQIYFSSKELAERAKDIFKEELEKFFGIWMPF